MIFNFMVKLFERFTSYNPEVMRWSKEQEDLAWSATEKIRRDNAMERELLSRRQSHG